MSAVHALHPQPALEDVIAAAVAAAVAPHIEAAVARVVEHERSRQVAWSKARAAELLDISEDLVDELVANGTLPSVRLGQRRVLIPDQALRDRIAELARTTP